MARSTHRGGMRVVVGVIVVALIVLAVVLSLRCQGPTTAGGFDYFRHKAAELGNDRARVIAFVRDEVADLTHRGNAKGALAALWDGAASPDEKLDLCNAMLAHCASAAPATLSDVAPRRDEATDASEAAKRVSNITITHRLLADGGPKETEICSAPVGSFVGAGHSVDVPEWGVTRFVLRGVLEKPAIVKTAGAKGEEVVFKIDDPLGSTVEVTRELWRRENLAGQFISAKGDRHDFVVLPCRVSKFVRDKEEELLKAAGTEGIDASRHYLSLLDYCRLSDVALETIEKDNDVRARYELPRILILSGHNLPDALGGPRKAFDLRLNRTSFEGKPGSAYRATQIRAFLEAGLEHHFLKKLTGRAVVSAHDIFGKLGVDPSVAANPAARVGAIATAIRDFWLNAHSDGSVTFTARAPDGAAIPDAPAVVVTKADDALRLAGPSPHDGMLDLLAKRGIELPVKDGRIAGEYTKPGALALAVEAALMAGTENLDAAYVLDARIDVGTRPLLTPGTIMYQVDTKTQKHSRYEYAGTAGSLAYEFRVKRGSSDVPGELVVTAKARDDARILLASYTNDKRTLDDATATVMSRAVYDDLKAARDAEFALSNNPGRKMKLVYKGTMTMPIVINGKEYPLTMFDTRLGAKPIRILDDREFPILTVDRVKWISAPLLGRVVDENGAGIAGATVEVRGSQSASATTWTGGGFRLPAAKEKAYGRVGLTVTHGGVEVARTSLDLSAPGLDALVVEARRTPSTKTVATKEGRPGWRIGVAWIAPGDTAHLEKLPISDQAKRHARRHLASGRHLAMPEKMVPYGEGSTYGFYAFETRTGHAIAVCESGLHGDDPGILVGAAKDPAGTLKGIAVDWAVNQSRQSVDELIDGLNMQEDVDAAAHELNNLFHSKKKWGMIDALHAHRGALAAWYGYSRHRVDELPHRLAIKAVLAELSYWADVCDLASGVKEEFGDTIGGWFESLLNKAMDGVAGEEAQKSFKMGYLSAILHLEANFAE